MFKRFWWVFLVMVPIGALVGFGLSSIVTYVMPKKFESTVTLQVRPFPSAQPLASEAFSPEAPGESRITPEFFGTQFEVIKSRNVLEKVVENLELKNRWNVDKETAMRILKGIVNSQNIRGTDLISIRVRHTNQVDAREIAEEVANAYKAYRAEIESETADAMLQELNKAIRDQEDKVEERRKVLATIVRTKGIVYRDFNGDAARERLQSFHQLDQEKMQLESQIASLLKYEGEQLMVYAAALDHPDNLVKNLYSQYLEEKRWVEEKKAEGLKDDDPSVRAANANIAEMKSQLEEGVVKLRESLKGQLDRISARSNQTTRRNQPQAIQPGADAASYVDAKRAFEADQELLQAMKLKQVEITVSRRTPNDSVTIHELPVIADSPVSPNVTVNLVLGSALGLLLSPLMALLVLWVLNRMIPAKPSA